MFVRQRDLEVIGFEGLEIFDYTAGTSSSSSVALIQVPPGARHPEAWSRRSDKYYLVVRGAVRFSLEGDERVLAQGDFCRVEQGKRFRYENATGAAATLLLVHTPSFELDEEVFSDPQRG